ncbi:hypothetical protein V6N13_048076 [Hibiscus sabdariffa]|uniref:Uncharacterized protein n=1 Tax=Hibiscus sabdariffa TaxID=183260 RepID=A0ABR2F632_9ROSI
MENGDAFEASSSARIGSSSIWKNNAWPMEAFSMSTREEDDEEDLKWSSIEKLPSAYLPARKASENCRRCRKKPLPILNDIGGIILPPR